jgi:O-antigen/teichoic acid export membrane protein
MPVFSRLEAKADPRKYLRPYILIYKVSCYFAVFGAASVWLWCEPFIVRWVGPEYIESAKITKILLIGTLCGAMQMPAINLLFGTSKHAFYAKINWLEAAIILVMSYVWGMSYGLDGIAYAYTLSMVVVKMGLQPWGAARVLEIGLWRYHLQTIPAVLKALAFALPMILLLEPHVVPKYPPIFAGAALCSVAFVGYIYFAGFTPEERAKLRDAVYKRKSAKS